MATSFASRERVGDRTSLLQTVFLAISLQANEDISKGPELLGFAGALGIDRLQIFT
jgi:hypothetical protein